jgi:hypothetical protein
MVCPTGAITAPGLQGARWLAACRERRSPPDRVFPPEGSGRRLLIPDDLGLVPADAGVLILFDARGVVVRIAGVPDLEAGLLGVIRVPVGAEASSFEFEVSPLYTQRETELLARYAREHGRLPAGNDLGDGLFGGEE